MNKSYVPLLVALMALVVIGTRSADAQVAPTWSWGPSDINQALINYADPPDASPPPVPDEVYTTAEVGLGNRVYGPTVITSTGNAAAASATSSSAVRAALLAGHHRRRRGLKATAYPKPGSGAAASGKGSSTSTGTGATATAYASGAVLTYSGSGLMRAITGANTGFDGIGVPQTRLVPEDISLAVGNNAAVHTANSLIRFYRVDVAGKKIKNTVKDPFDSSTFLKQVWASDFFYAVTKTGTGANGCDQGIFAMSAAYDKWVGRFVISAICDDWLHPKVLLAVSATDSVTGYWNLYSAPADNQPTSWKCANGRRGYPDYTQIGYNRDGVFVTWVSICREAVTTDAEIESGAMLYAWPKWAIYGGNDPSLPGKMFWVPVYTGQDLCTAVKDQAPYTLPDGGDCGAAFTQLQPVKPQMAADVRAGETFFVLDFNWNQPSRRKFVLAALVATGTLWDHNGQGTPSPYLVGRFIDRGDDAYIYDDVYLKQASTDGMNAPDLEAGALNPRGYWNGGATFANGRIYIADRADVQDLPSPPSDNSTEIYNPRPAIYWAWVVPTFTAYGPCACYWNFNWGYGFAWVWDKACYNPVTGVLAGGGGGAYAGRRRRRLAGEAENSSDPAAASSASSERAPGGAGAPRRLQGTALGSTARWSATFPGRDRNTIIPNGGTAAGSTGGTASSSTGTSWSTTRQRRTPNMVYTAAAGAVDYTIKTQARAGASVVTPPLTEAAAAKIAPASLTAAQEAAVASATANAKGSWVSAASTSASGTQAGQWRDVYMAAAYYNPAMFSWTIDFSCRFTYDWNIRNTVTLLATIVKSGVITYGSAAGETDAPLGLAYPQVAVRGGTMLVTYTYSSYANIPDIPGVRFSGQPAYAGVGFTLINPTTAATAVNVAYQQDPSYGPIVQANGRFGTYAGIDMHPISGRVWSANPYVWAPAYTVDGSTVQSNAGARITVFS